jgi:hypothetical protein
MIGVNFQPGSQEGSGNAKPSSGSGVQEAIKVLSLRLPRVLGAQAAVPAPLLTSQGSGGNPRVDSIVNQIMARLPQQNMTAPMMAGDPQSDGPSFSGSAQPNYQPQPQPWTPPANFDPRVIIGGPLQPRWPGQSQDDNGGPMPGAVLPAPYPGVDIAPFQPPFPNITEPIFKRDAPSFGGGSDQPNFDSPLF